MRTGPSLGPTGTHPPFCRVGRALGADAGGGVREGVEELYFFLYLKKTELFVFIYLFVISSVSKTV